MVTTRKVLCDAADRPCDIAVAGDKLVFAKAQNDGEQTLLERRSAHGPPIAKDKLFRDAASASQAK